MEATYYDTLMKEHYAVKVYQNDEHWGKNSTCRVYRDHKYVKGAYGVTPEQAIAAYERITGHKQLIDWPEDNVNYWWFLGLMALSTAIVVCLGYVLWDKFF